MIRWVNLFFFSLYSFAASGQPGRVYETISDSEGGIVKLNRLEKKVHLLFSAHEFGEGGSFILDALKGQQVKASFFFTGDFLRNEAYKEMVKRMVREGHYIGSHSDKHLLYADWSRRDSLLVTRDSFQRDLRRSLQELERFGVKNARWYLCPYEWYNREVVQWCADNGLTVVNFTPGPGTNADYTIPGQHNYRSNDVLLMKLWNYEEANGLDGYMLLLHLGTDPRRREKLYHHLPDIIKRLKQLGYSFEKLPG